MACSTQYRRTKRRERTEPSPESRARCTAAPGVGTPRYGAQIVGAPSPPPRALTPLAPPPVQLRL
ncbi:unnamed protein product [Plutella xylostella]|uniref:(diamondback moth) hypothetical protein n=1 Tax=Plutella xylostella TaxID=51655 RepID=A0A8S4DA31_PLUXY|nr:unnamed protein product [Plutella xylostella]